MSDNKKYLSVNKITGELELTDFPYPEKEREILDSLYNEFAFEPLDRETIKKMNDFVIDQLEVLKC